jgi:hypothetical protein
VEIKQYRVTIKTPAELVYYVSEYDAEAAVNLAIDAPFREWEVSDFEMPLGSDVNIEEV